MATLQEQIEKAVREAVHRDRYRDSPTDRAVARHEVAHALASHTVGLKMASISVSDHSSGVMRNVDRPKPEVDGTPEEIAARLRREYPDAIAKACRKEIVTFLAGRAADEFAGDKGLPVSASASDLAEADKAADVAVGREGRDRLLESCRADAAEIVKTGWPLIQEFAALLVFEREMPGFVLEIMFSERDLAATLREAYEARPAGGEYSPLFPPPAPPAEPDWWSDA